MPQTAVVTDEMLQLFKKVLRLTRAASLAWEPTADSAVLVAPLSADYTVKIALVPDFDEDSEEPVPDHVLTVTKGRKALFSLDRRDIAKGDLVTFRREFADVLEGPEDWPYTLFRELWDRANFKASKIDEEVQTLNRILDAKLKSDT